MNPQSQRQFPFRNVGAELETELLRHADQIAPELNPGEAVAPVRAAAEIVGERDGLLPAARRTAAELRVDFAAPLMSQAPSVPTGISANSGAAESPNEAAANSMEKNNFICGNPFNSCGWDQG